MNERVRIRTHPPLKPFQAWIPVSPSEPISKLKNEIRKLLETNDITLELDGFAFLDQSLCSVIDAAHDLIDVKAVSPQPSKKRRRSESASSPQPTERQDQPELPSSTIKKNDSKPKNSPAPPGQGKQSTKNRNQRKRLKRTRDREQRRSGLAQLNQNSISKPAQSKSTQSKPAQPTKDDKKESRLPQIKLIIIIIIIIISSESESESEPQTSVPKSTTSDQSSQPSELTSKCTTKTPAPILKNTISITQTPTTQKITSITQKTVPIIPNPQLNMLSLSNKNKRKNVKRKSCPDQLSQPTKIVFGESGTTTTTPEKPEKSGVVASPCYMPPSPNVKMSTATPTLCEANSITDQGNPGSESVPLNNEGEEEEEDLEFVDHSITHLARSHGPPPSARDAELIPANVLITSINVLSPYWTPGQIGDRSDHHDTNYTDQVDADPTSTTITAKNNPVPEDEEEQDVDMDDDDEEEEDEDDEDQMIQQDVEDAYAEFIGSGGHSSRTINPDLNVQQTSGTDLHHQFLETLNHKWDQLEKADRKNIVLGSQVAIRTIELSMQSFTPEPVTYYGKVTGVNEVSIALRLDPRSIPPTTSEDKGESERKGDDDDGGEGEEGEEWIIELEEEERMVDVKEAIRAHHRRSFATQLDGLSSLDCRDWEWNTILDARKL
ncbi:hypothetical protein KEM48_014439 [Puccinia striiformis f. sp. tritici PST-130]|nr:hypothetical protein KEM48_014439 [Puccinia striiformis f. sp. tritici PST-130]